MRSVIISNPTINVPSPKVAPRYGTYVALLVLVHTSNIVQAVRMYLLVGQQYPDKIFVFVRCCHPLARWRAQLRSL
eukprot:scaffold599702_cov38-Prasinocladus_malaysianus.AAC.1